MQRTSPRIAPASPKTMTDEQKALVGKWGRMNFAAVIVQHPELYRALMPLIAKLISSSNLPPRDREILVLRTLGLYDEIYETHHHASIARNAGMTDSEIEMVRTGRAGLSPFDQTLVRAAEELIRDRRVSDETWRALAQRYSRVECSGLYWHFIDVVWVMLFAILCLV